MWVKRAVYEAMKDMAEHNEHDADLLRRLVFSLETSEIIHHPQVVIMKPEVYDKISSQIHIAENTAKEAIAELEWYKVKYHELKMGNCNNEGGGK